MDQPTVRNLLSRYATENLQLKAGSVGALSASVTALDRYLGRPCMTAELSRELLLGFTRDTLQKQSTRTARNNRANILTLWRWAADRGVLPEPGRIPTVRSPKRTPQAWRPEEIASIVLACRSLPGEIKGTAIPQNVWWESLVLFLLFVAPRIKAALSVRSADVSIPRRTVILRAESAKTGAEQVLRLHPQVCESLARIYNRKRDLVWPWPYCRRLLWDGLREILAEAKLPNDRYHLFHCFRKTCFTWTTKAAGLAVARHQLGHKSDLSSIYLDTTQLEDIQAADVLPRVEI